MSNRSRASGLEALRNNPDPDVLIVGGGINGIGTFRDLALQGIKVILVERDDYCSGASGALSRMIHGGLRYMENGEFKLVKESLRERNLLLRNAPHYVSPLQTVVPIYGYFSGFIGAVLRFLKLSEKPTRRGALIVKIGLSLYDLFTGRNQTMPGHSFLGRAKTRERWPDFHADVKCSATYYDARIAYPERLGLEMILDTEDLCPDGLAVNYMGVDGMAGKTVTMTDGPSREKFSVTPKIIVNATGGWIDLTNGALSASSGAGPSKLIGGTKGSHLIVCNEHLLNATGGQMVYFENQDGRICILCPHFGNVLVGTTDLKVDDPEGVKCENSERDYILESLSFVFPKITINPSDIRYVFSGVRPLPASDSKMTGRISRDHHCKVLTEKDGFETPVLCMVGGKWTTFRAFGEQTTDLILDMLKASRQTRTDHLPIGGGSGFPTTKEAIDLWIMKLVGRTGTDQTRIQKLVERYGSRAEIVASFLSDGADQELISLPKYSRREIIFIIKNEHVESLGDILFRRTAIAISGDISLAAIDEILGILIAEKGWAKSRGEAERASLLSRLSDYHGLSEELLSQR